MRRIAGISVTLIAAAGATSIVLAQAGQPRKLPANQTVAQDAAVVVLSPEEVAAKLAAMENVLALWEAQSKKLTALDAAFTRIDKSLGWGNQEEYRGRAYLQSPNLACLHLQEVVQPMKAGEKPSLKEHERIVCTGKEVLQYDYTTKQIFRFPLDKRERKRALPEGPLPFLFSMKAAEAKQAYDMSLMNETAEAYLINIKPHQRANKTVFSKAFIQLNKATLLPDRLVLVSPNGKDTQDYVFTGVQANGRINAEFFMARAIEGWKLIDNPQQDAGAKQVPRVNPAGPPRVGQGPGREPLAK